jgi:hypothetical protein
MGIWNVEYFVYLLGYLEKFIMNIYTPKKCRGIINLKKLLGIVDYIPATIPPLSIPVFPQPFIDNWLSTRTGNLDKNA